MASIEPGTYTFAEVFRLAGFDFEGEAAAEYNNGGPDYRRVIVGGLGFDDVEDRFVVPVTADKLVISLDGAEHTVLDVDASADEHQRELELARSVAAIHLGDEKSSKKSSGSK